MAIQIKNRSLFPVIAIFTVVIGKSRLKCGVPHGTHRPAEPTVFKEKTGSERGILFDRRGSDEQKHTKIHVYDADGTV